MKRARVVSRKKPDLAIFKESRIQAELEFLNTKKLGSSLCFDYWYCNLSYDPICLSVGRSVGLLVCLS